MTKALSGSRMKFTSESEEYVQTNNFGFNLHYNENYVVNTRNIHF